MRSVLRFFLAAAVLADGGFAFAQALDRVRTPDPAPPLAIPQDPQEARCRRLLREFAVSSACYSRFRTVKGIKSEAFDRCGPPVNDPRGTECPLKR